MFKIFKNLWRQAVPDYLKGSTIPYLEYFNQSDNFTLKWAKAISESPSATSCLSTLSDFIEGYGFSDTQLEEQKVNRKGETLWQIHQKTCREYAQNEGFFWLLRFNATGKITEWEVLPFENCRLGKPDDGGYISKIYYNPFFGTEYYTSISKSTKCYDAFNLLSVKQQMVEQKSKFKGQIFYFGTTTSLTRFYPINEAYSAVKWMKIEAGISNYHEDNIDNGFLQAFMLIMKGDPNRASNNPQYDNNNKPEHERTTVAQEFDEVVSANFMGAKRVGNMFVQWVENPEEKPEVLTLPSNGNGDLFITLDNQAIKKITVAWKVPAILANIQEGVSLGGDGNQIRVAVKLMQQRVVKRQRHLTDAYSEIMKNFYEPYMQEIQIVPYNPYPELETLDKTIWDTLSDEEKRNWIQENTEVDLQSLQTKVVIPGQVSPVIPVKNAIPVGFPDKIRNHIQDTIDYQNQMNLGCAGKGSMQVSNMIVNNASIPFKQLKRIHNYLSAREQYANSPNSEGCEVVKYNLWGGKPMCDFLSAKMKEIDSWLN